ncbi:hypothetical protein J6590_003518 [Homalodisca vitripennis]|nr:hypothetical protein J6590_003518 [Homalodisca vitripennis]
MTGGVKPESRLRSRSRFQLLSPSHPVSWSSTLYLCLHFRPLVNNTGKGSGHDLTQPAYSFGKIHHRTQLVLQALHSYKGNLVPDEVLKWRNNISNIKRLARKLCSPLARRRSGTCSSTNIISSPLVDVVLKHKKHSGPISYEADMCIKTEILGEDTLLPLIVFPEGSVSSEEWDS